MNFTEPDLLNFIYFFISISIVIPTFFLSFGNWILEATAKECDEVRIKALKIISKNKNDILSKNLEDLIINMESYFRISRFLLVALCIISFMSFVAGLVAIVKSGMEIPIFEYQLFNVNIPKVDVIVGLLSLQFIFFYLNVVIAIIYQPNTKVKKLKEYLLREHTKDYLET
jgi:hypothetical protein